MPRINSGKPPMPQINKNTVPLIQCTGGNPFSVKSPKHETEVQPQQIIHP